MEAKYWIYIVLGGIYFLSRFLKKPEAQESGQAPENGNKPRPQNSQEPRQLTFEELLREITEGKQAPQPAKPVVVARQPERKYVDYDDDIRDEEQSLETIQEEIRPRDDRRTYEEYEKAKAAAFNRPSLEETLKLSDAKVEFGKFKAFEVSPQPDLLNQYTKAFQDPQGLRAAIVMSEILNRKF